MMNYHVLTLFPEMIREGLNTSIIGRAIAGGHLSLEAVNIRDFAGNRRGKVDDYPYGGGAGMVMQAEPIYQACQSVQERTGRKSRVIYVTPQGAVFNQRMAEEFAKEEDLIFLCGHYEGVDERVLEEIVTDYVSIGDYVLTGGELAAMVMIDAISRLVPGVLNNEESAEFESFQGDLLEYPQYSRPEVWREKRVPEVLLCGDHKKVDAWRLEQSRARTWERRPDLYAKYTKAQEEWERLHPVKQKRLRRKKRKLAGVIFDMDGCIADTQGLYEVGWAAALKEFGIELELERARSWTGCGTSFIDGEIDKLTQDPALTQEVRRRREAFILQMAEEGKISPKPYAKELLTYLKSRGLKLVLATSSQKKRAEKILKSCELYDFFDVLLFEDYVEKAKPDPDIYLKALEEGNLTREEALVFEDSVVGAMAGIRAGLRVMYVPEPEREVEVRKLAYFRKIADLGEGMELIRELF